MKQPVNVDVEACFNNPEIYAEAVAMLQDQSNCSREDAETMLDALIVHLGFNLDMKAKL